MPAPKIVPAIDTVTYNAGGWGGTGKFSMQRQDQGQDFEIEINGWITAPGDAEVIAHSSDTPFPEGFGTPYAIVKVTSGQFNIGNGEWYVGHCNVDVKPVGTKLKLGDPIARANNSLNPGWGWCELGKWDNGPHEMGEGEKYHSLFAPLNGAKGTTEGNSNIAVGEPEVGGAGESGISAEAAQSISTGAAVSAFINLPGLFETEESLSLKGERSLMNDQPLLPFIEQLTKGSLRNFMSLPNGDFFAFIPDYFGGLTGRTPYWEIDDIEILDGEIVLSDDALATHVYIVGDTGVINQEIELGEKMQTMGVVTVFNAFMADFLNGINSPALTEEGKPKDTTTRQYIEDEEKVPSLANKAKATAFLERYGARPFYEEAPMIRSHYFEAFLAYQMFCLLWSKQFLTTFEFTLMPELIPGGLVAFPEHGLQCYIDEVQHTGDYTSGFRTRANLSAPAALPNGDKNLNAGMIRAGIFNPEAVAGARTSKGKNGNKGQTGSKHA
jgi:hypothetical protein